MTQRERTYRLLLEHSLRYPKLQPRDVFKYIYQSALGCEHLVSSQSDAISYIKQEYASMAKSERAAIEPLDGGYCRVPLTILQDGMTPETLGKLFFRSAKIEPDGMARLQEKIAVAREMAEKELFSFSLSEDGEAEGFARVAETYILSHLGRGFGTLDYYHSTLELSK